MTVKTKSGLNFELSPSKNGEMDKIDSWLRKL